MVTGDLLDEFHNIHTLEIINEYCNIIGISWNILVLKLNLRNS